MSKLCKKEDCGFQSVKKSKYCINHCSKKLREQVMKEEEVINRQAILFLQEEMKLQEIEIELERKTMEEVRILDERILREEQEKEYEETIQKDLERMAQKELERELTLKNNLERINNRTQIENDKRIEIEKKRQNITKHGEELFYKFKFSVLNTSMLASFPEKSRISNLFDFIDVFMYDNKIDTKFENGYELILYPNITITKMMAECNLSEIIKTYNNKIQVKEIEN